HEPVPRPDVAAVGGALSRIGGLGVGAGHHGDQPADLRCRRHPARPLRSRRVGALVVHLRRPHRRVCGRPGRRSVPSCPPPCSSILTPPGAGLIAPARSDMLQLSDLPALNATLNGISAAFLVCGYALVRRGRYTSHKRCMLGALAASTLFLVSYLVYHANVG